MSQHVEVVNAITRYTRSDFMALRAYLSKIPADVVLEHYYSEDDLLALGINGSKNLERHLETMRDNLIGHLSEVNSDVAKALQRARRSAVWSKTAINYLIGAADGTVSRPHAADTVSQWLKPIVAKRLKEDGIYTLGDLVASIRARGKGWYLSIPCLGKGKAKTIIHWLRQCDGALGELPAWILDPENEIRSNVVLLQPSTTAMVPLERMALAEDLDGSHGTNRHQLLPLILARHDLDAIKVYLCKHRANDKTYRAYRRELERFLLWCIRGAGKPMSSILFDDCEAYKNFLENPGPSWIGLRRPRESADWRPFASAPGPGSQLYAVRILRTFFDWLVKVRYLAGNPWAGVSDPLAELAIQPIQICKALPSNLWDKLAGPGGILDQLCALPDAELRARYKLRGFAARQPFGAQFRLVRAALLLIGTTGIRREEAACAMRNKLVRLQGHKALWRLAVLGKRKRWRYVYLDARVYEALEAHWRDRGEDFSFGMSEIPLLSPVIVPATHHSRQKHGGSKGGSKGFSVDGIYTMLTASLKRIAADGEIELTPKERIVLCHSCVRVFRHTFGSQSFADGMSLNVLQTLLGHANLNTTTVYVQSDDESASDAMIDWLEKRIATRP